jgi:hypothetical protein
MLTYKVFMSAHKVLYFDAWGVYVDAWSIYMLIDVRLNIIDKV